MYLHFYSELLQLCSEVEQLWAPELNGASDAAKFISAKGKVLDILDVLYGKDSREFRIVQLTRSPATIVKVVKHLIRRFDIRSANTRAVNM